MDESKRWEGKLSLVHCCVYMPTYCTNSAGIGGWYEKQRMHLVLRKREGWYCLGILIPGLVSL